MACRNLNKVRLTIETFHGEHGAQTVARIGQVSTQKAHNHFERRRFSQGHREQACGRVSQMTGPIDRLLQTVALVLAAALVAGYWPVRWATRQPEVEGPRDELGEVEA